MAAEKVLLKTFQIFGNWYISSMGGRGAFNLYVTYGKNVGRYLVAKNEKDIKFHS